MREEDIKNYTKITNMIEHSFKNVNERANKLNIVASSLKKTEKEAFQGC